MPGADRTLVVQAFRLHQDFPNGTVRLRPTVLMWTARLTPTPLSREYTVRITYVRGHYPRVVIVEPRLEAEERKLLHHLYPNGDLCLHKLDEWEPSMLLIDTIIPWTAEWLAHYELWKRTHHWYGDGDRSEVKPPAADPPPIPNGPVNHSERRWEARAKARRARRERRDSARPT